MENKHYPESWFEKILNSMSDLVLVKGPKSKLLWANKSFLKYYGMTEEQLRNIVDAPHSDPDDTLQYVKDDHFVFTRSERLEVKSEPVTNFNGEVKFFKTIKDPIKSQNGEVIMTVGVSRQIQDEEIIQKSDFERSERKESTSELKALITALPSPVVMLDATNRIIAFSLEWKEMFPAEEGVLEKNFEDVYCPSLGMILEKINLVKKDFSPFQFKELELVLNERPHTLNVKIKPWKFPNGDIGGVIVMVNDITEIQELNTLLEQKVALRTKELTDVLENLRHTQTALIHQEKQAGLGRMAGGIAHEINNPLAIISILVGSIKKQLEKEIIAKEKVEVSLKEIDSTVKRISKIISAMRTVSRDTESFTKDSVPVKAIFDDVLGLCEQRYKVHGVNLSVSPDLETLVTPLSCDQVQLSQVILNLLDNAFDAVQEAKNKWVKIEVQREHGHDYIKVSDSGPGISVEATGKIYEPFYTTKPVGKGTGLGLAISKTIVEKHGGTLQLDPTNTFTTFVIKIPIN